MFWSAARILALCFALYWVFKLILRFFKWRDLKVIPGPECGFWLGCLPEIRRDPFMAPHKRWLAKFGYDVPFIRYSMVMGWNSLLVLDKEIIKEILMAPAAKDDCRFRKPVFFLPAILGNGLVTLEGEEWAKHRRIIHPAFSLSFLKDALSVSVPPKVQKFVQCWLAAGDGQEIDLGSHLSALTLDVIGDAGFSYDTSGLKDIEAWSRAAARANLHGDKDASKSPELTDPLIVSMMALLTPDLPRLLLMIFGLGYLDVLVNPKTVKVKAALNLTVESIISNAKQRHGKTGDELSSKKSLLHLLLKANDAEGTGKNALTDQDLKDELKTFLLAGHETTSTWCYWALYAMAKHPDVQDKLFEDVTKNLQDPDSATVSLEEVEKMEYLSGFLNEVLRLFPPVGMMIRQNCFEETLAGFKIPKGTHLVIPTHLLHRNPNFWTEPETFKPERWVDKDSNGAGGIDTRGFTFLPFGAGGHNCIGYKFATLEAKLIIAHMSRTLRVEIAPSQRNVEHTFTSTITMKAKPGLKVVVKPRQ
jgi:cytochrome P450